MHWNIVGAGRIGLALVKMADGKATLFHRNDSLQNMKAGPIVLCVRNDDLADIIPHLPKERHQDCIFVQNGMLQSWLIEHGLENCTQSLLYFAVAKRGDEPVDGGRTVTMGKWAFEFQELLQKGNIQSEVVSKEDFDVSMCSKYLWICVMSVLCDYYQCDVGTVLDKYSDSIRELTIECSTIVAKHTGIPLGDQLYKELNDYTRTIPHYRCSVKEWKWRNGWLWDREPSVLHQRFLGETIQKYENKS